MTTTTDAPGTTPTSVRDALTAARAARDEGMAAAEHPDAAAWDRALIDQAIAAFAVTGTPFSANDLRELLPEVRSALIGSRFMAASVGSRIRRVGRTTSTKKNTHAKDVALWVGLDQAGDGR